VINEKFISHQMSLLNANHRNCFFHPLTEYRGKRHLSFTLAFRCRTRYFFTVCL